MGARDAQVLMPTWPALYQLAISTSLSPFLEWQLQYTYEHIAEDCQTQFLQPALRVLLSL